MFSERVDPLDRTAQLQCELPGDDAFSRKVLRSERPTDIGGDHPHPLGLHAQKAGEDAVDHVWHLTGQVHCKGEVTARRIDEDGAAFHRNDSHALVLEAASDDNFGIGERVLRATSQADEYVAVHRLELKGRIRRESVFHVDHRPERLVVDLDELGGVHSQSSRLGDYYDHRIADEVDGPLCERGSYGRRMEHHQGRSVRKIQVLSAVDTDHSRHIAGLCDVDRADPCVGDRRTNEVEGEDALDLHVVHVGAGAPEQGRIFDPANGLARERPSPESSSFGCHRVASSSARRTSTLARCRRKSVDALMSLGGLVPSSAAIAASSAAAPFASATSDAVARSGVEPMLTRAIPAVWLTTAATPTIAQS